MEIKKWGPQDFELETNTVWSFPERGDWATHDDKHQGNWSPYIPRNLLLRYSQAGDSVLDQFCGGGSTLVEAKLLGRNIVGMDINPDSLNHCLEKIDFNFLDSGNVDVRHGDARSLDSISDGEMDFICTNPPHADIIRYSHNIPQDLSGFSVGSFLSAMEIVAAESYRVLKPGKFCAILMGDPRRKGHVVPVSFNVMRIFEAVGFRIKEIIVRERRNRKPRGYWKNSSLEHNFLMIAHEHIFVFTK
jgi:DNA modification methylase